MDSQLLYQQDVNKLEFEAEVVEILTLPDRQTGVVLDQSYFYPTGGGQEHDTGWIGSARVVDVIKDESNQRLVHVVEGEVALGLVQARIDIERRLRHMQHHTAQHLLTECLLKLAGCETVSANINGYTPSTLDVIASQISKANLDQAELLANQIIYENRLVKTYIVSPEELASIPLRRPPKVSDNIRIVEIDSFDYSPCGGTHVARTGSIGLLKVLKTERQNEKVRVYFIAGLQAMQTFHQMYDTFTNLANQQSTGWQELPGLFSKQAEQLGSLQKDLQTLRLQNARYEAHELATRAEAIEGIRQVKVSFENRPSAELRMLAEELKKMADLIAVLTSFDGQKLSLIVTCGQDSGMDARQILNLQLSPLNGRGGGDMSLAQGGAAATAEQYAAFAQQLNSR